MNIQPLGGAFGTKQVFQIVGTDILFAPAYVPSRFSVTKERNLDHDENFCGLEDISDLGSKNRVLHISGVLKENEIGAFASVLDYDEPVDLTTPGWSGEIRVKEGEYEGPISLDPSDQQPLYKFSLDVVSTGRDEGRRRDEDHGVINSGTTNYAGAEGI